MSDTYLAHYGILRRSGRYPWGSGGTQNVRNKTFLDYVANLKAQGLSETEIAQGAGITTTQLRAARTIANNQQKQQKIDMAVRLKAKGMSNVAIGERMGIPESSVRGLLADSAKEKVDILMATSGMLKREVDDKGFIDIGSGVENHLGLSKEKLGAAVALLKEEGYTVHTVQVDQAGTGHKTNVKVLGPPGTTYRDKAKAVPLGGIKQIQEYSEDGGRSFLGIQTPISISSKRIAIRYNEQGGGDFDGVIYVRPGKEDLSLGKSHYAQVRIAVDGSHYLKGMAVYKDDLPDGVDLLFNTNKSDTGNKLDAMKALKEDPDNPFGSVVRQLGEHDAHGRLTKVTSAMNIVNEEGRWGGKVDADGNVVNGWSNTLSSQFLSKQSPKLISQQLDKSYGDSKKEFDEIMQLTNPAVRQKLLEDFAEGADASAVHLKAAALPRQATRVILPINSLKDNEVYAPSFTDGERVVLVRFPHGGKFEIPELVVNNRNREGRSTLGKDTTDAIGINSEVAKRLSGADFDGDTVLVIPNNKGQIKSEPALQQLSKFDPQQYKLPDDAPRMTARAKGIEMGNVSNLITDMTIKGANNDEIARAVKHSMVVIDAEKHHLDYKKSAQDNGILQLKQKYQGGGNKGASTIVSRKKSPVRVPERSRTFRVDPVTGEKIFRETGASYEKDGKTIFKTTTIKKLEAVKDAHDLVSDPGTLRERLYADHSNRMKALANQARKEAVNTKATPWSESAKKTYSTEVAELNASLNVALKNAPKERAAQLLAQTVVSAKRAANPDMDKAEVAKLKSLALEEARARYGARKERIQITPNQWAAIQAGAISNSKLKRILDNADMDRVKELATPRAKPLMTSAYKARAQAMIAAGATQAEVANALGVSLTTLKTSLGGG